MEQVLREVTGGSGGARYAAASLLAIALYSLVALVVFPEGSPSVGARLLALLLIAMGGLATVVVARLAPRWIRGLGMLAVGFGMVAVLVGVVGERLMKTPSVTAVLGLVAGAGGVVLVVLGWQRLLAGLDRRWLRVVAAVAGTLVIAQLLLLPAVAALLVTNRARPQLSERTPADLGLTAEDVRIAMADGTELAAWWVPSRNEAAVIMLPGSGSTRDDVLDHASFIAEAGYGVMLVDLRGHGDSAGRLMDLGWGAERDVRDVVSWIEGREIYRVGVFGLSMGGEIALTTAAEDPRVAAVVAEGATARTAQDRAQVPEPNPVARAVTGLQFAMIRALAPEPEPIALIDAVRAIDAPVLLIEGSGPLEPAMGPLLRDAAPRTVTLWAIPESPHVDGLSTRPDEYRRAVLDLFHETLG